MPCRRCGTMGEKTRPYKPQGKQTTALALHLATLTAREALGQGVMLCFELRLLTEEKVLGCLGCIGFRDLRLGKLSTMRAACVPLASSPYVLAAYNLSRNSV